MSTRVVFMFKPQFAPLVKSGAKKQTIRPGMKRKIEPGMIADCREWKGKPYRSKHRKLMHGVITSVHHILISQLAITITPPLFVPPGTRIDEFAKRDGFKDMDDMLNWFRKTHGLPFRGRLIIWK